ncbi:S9 family peptidase [Tunicatimonas pelagia]|nr:S9 family peptidase [Tunicatimonas pelagia]WKN46357.1 S9 family peptidase [Tunicatimonas pelagia]
MIEIREISKKTNFIAILSPLLLLYTSSSWGQTDSLTLEAIYGQSLFSQADVKGINWMDNGQYYTSQVQEESEYYQHIIQYDITTGEAVDTLVNGRNLIPEDEPYALSYQQYSFSPNGNKVLIATELAPIYRRSSQAYYYVYDRTDGSFRPLVDGGKQSYATFSPDGSKVAFVRNNNLFYVTLSDGSITQVTSDGEKNKLIHGSTDWVYEEEFSVTKAFFWSPTGDKIAYASFNEATVPEYNMQVWNGLYPEDYRFKYPKAGETNSKVNVSIYQLEDQQTVSVDLGEETDIYVPRMQWTTDNNQLSIIRMNRLQNQLEIIHANATTGKATVVLTEESNTYVDLDFNDQLIYLKNGEQFVRTSEQDGFKHIYLHTVDGSLVRQITQGNWEVSEFLGVDEDKKLIYYTSTEVSPLERHLYTVRMDGKRKKRLTELPGTHSITLNPDFTYYIDRYSSSDQPLVVGLHQAPSGKLVKVLEDNAKLKKAVASYRMGAKEYIQVPVDDTLKLNAYVIKPADFDSTKTYPLLMFVYGGPGSQLVRDSWLAGHEPWFHYLAQKGYLVACVDNRGTGARGRDFRTVTYNNLGKYEVADQIASARYFGKLPYIDAERIGIWGWSYGGYMTLLSTLLGSDVFSLGVSVAPVTNWRLYDTIYTERYLQTPQLNPKGYDEYSPLTHAEKLEADLLLIHGTGDDNVHFQNAVEMQNALIAAGKSFDSFYYPNRNHGIYGGNTRLHLFTMITAFITENL